MKNKNYTIGCPKLDDADYVEKFTAIIKTHEIKSITITAYGGSMLAVFLMP